jgi:membrane protein
MEENKPSVAQTRKAVKEKFIDMVKVKIKFLISAGRKLLNDIYIGERGFSTALSKSINAVKVFIIATRKFLTDDCTTKASSIAYATIVSLIPTLTVAITFYSVFSGVGSNQQELFDKITRMMIENNVKLNIDPIIEALSGLIENAGKIGGVGAVVMIFSATAILRTLEQSLNDIWKVKKARPMFLRIIYYWAALTLGPLMILSATTVANQVSTTFSSPNYTASHFTKDGGMWVTGNKSIIQYSANQDLKFVPITTDNIDFDNQRIFEYDSASKAFNEYEFRIEPLDYKKTVYKDIQFIGDFGIAVGKDGMILRTNNRGRTWFLEKWGGLNFNRISMLDAKKGFILSDNGKLLSTIDGGKSWSVREWENVNSSLNSIAFKGAQGIIVGEKGVMITTLNGGTDWTLNYLKEAKKKSKYFNLNAVGFISDDALWVVGDGGTILISSNDGKTWTSRKFQETNYYAAYFPNRNTGFIAGDNGIVINTTDGGAKWNKKSFGASRINEMIPREKAIWIFGDSGMIMKSEDHGKSWSGIHGKSFLFHLLNFAAPFIFVWLLFLLAYIAMPNTKVPFKPAAIGAAFTGSVWVIFILLFSVYIRSFAGGTVAVYGALAAIPIFLLMVYASMVIILYGAEVAYTLMHPHTYKNLKKALKDTNDFHVIYGLSILHQIFGKFESGKGMTTQKDIMKIASNKADEVEHFIDIFKKENLIIEKEEGAYIPANSSGNLILADVIDLIHNVTLDMPPMMPQSDPVRKYMQKIIKNMEESRRKIVGTITLKDLIEGNQ